MNRDPARTGRMISRFLCGLGLLFLLLPILVIIPLSFNSERFFSYPMQGFSLRWYADLFGSAAWRLALVNSLVIGVSCTALALLVGGAAAIGLNRLKGRARGVLMAVLISPMMIPGVVTALALYLCYAPIGLSGSYPGVIIAHTILGVPFVIITLGAALLGFDGTLMRAAMSLGASPLTATRLVMVPLLMPAIVSSGLFVFVTSFDEFIVTLFLSSPTQRTLPLQMWTGVHDDVTPAILAAATLFIFVSVSMLICIEILRRRAAAMAGGRGG